MKKITIALIFLLSLFCFVCTGRAQEHNEKQKELSSSFELDAFSHFSKSENPEHNALAYVNAPIDNFRRWHQQYIFSYEGETTELLAGLTYELFDGFSFGAMAGFQNETKFRFGLSMLYEHNNMLAEALYEKGEGMHNNWHKFTAGFRPFAILLIGAREQSGIGIGPFAEVKIGHFSPYFMYGMSHTIIGEKTNFVSDETVRSLVAGIRYRIIF